MRARVKVKAKPPARTDSTPTKSVFETRPFGTQTSSTPFDHTDRDGLSNLELYLQRRKAHLAYHAKMAGRSPLPEMMMKAQGEEGAANQTVKEAGTHQENKSAIAQTMFTTGEGEMAREATGVISAQNDTLSTNTGRDGEVHQLKRAESTVVPAQSSKSVRDGLSNLKLYLQRRERHLAWHAEMANRSPLPILQPKWTDAAQRKSSADNQVVHEAGTHQENNTGLPDHLKTGLETLSGMAMDDVKVHYNSPKPAQLQALAYAQGTDIHVAPGQESHLPHEAWHVVQQKQGRVRPTMQMKGVGINDDQGLEKEADVMGAKAVSGQLTERWLDRGGTSSHIQRKRNSSRGKHTDSQAAIQRQIKFNYQDVADQNQQFDNNLRSYLKDFIEPEYTFILNKTKDMKGLDEFEEMKKAAKTLFKMKDNWEKSNKPAEDEAQIVEALNQLVERINNLFVYAKNTLERNVDSYSNTRDDSWKNTDDALKAMEELTANSELQDRQAKLQPKQNEPGQPNIPGIKWSQAKKKLPSALQNLIRDIYTSWRLGRRMDERDDDARTRREKNSNVAGALRSWHVNEQGQLPDISGAPIPQHGQALHQHYTRTGQHPYDKQNQAGPIGYAEYTGTGIERDPHNSKIVLDYKTGYVYITVTHYQLWDKQEDKYHIRNKKEGSGANSAWFYIDMNQ